MPRPRSQVRYAPREARYPSAPLRPSAIPSVDPWLAGEMFVSPHVEERRRGFALLVGGDVTRRSRLTQHLLISRVSEPDLTLRVQILQSLADYFEVRGQEYRYPPEMRAAVAEQLRRFDRAEVMAIVETQLPSLASNARLAMDSVGCLLERTPNAAQHLTRLAGDKTVTIEVRCAAVEVVGQVGFIDAVEALEGLAARLEGRRAGQLTLLYAPPDNADDVVLLPVLKAALRLLNEVE